MVFHRHRWWLMALGVSLLPLPLALAARPNRAEATPVPPQTAAGRAAMSAVPPTEQPILRDIAAAVSAERIEADIRTLVGFGTRHTLSDTLSDSRGIGAARRWIKAEFDRISEACGGCLDVSYQRSIVAGEPRIPDTTAIVNVIAILRGEADPGRHLIMSGDIDSRVSDPMDFTSPSPGANDNASGMAGVLEAARVLSRHRFAASIVFAALSGEEQGLYGGRALAEEAAAWAWRIEAVLNNDMIGNTSGINGVTDNTTARVFSEGTRAVYVGAVTEHTLESLVIDNYFFGVASVSPSGFESPVVFPGPAGAFF